MIDLLKIAKLIRETLEEERNKRELTFEEDEHRYQMIDNNGDITDKYPSVSTILKEFFSEFDSYGKSIEMCEEGNDKAAPFMVKANYDVEEGARLLRESWEEEGRIASNFGSYTHYKLEQYIWNLYDIEKDLRRPNYNLSEKEQKIGMELTNKGVNIIHNIIDSGFVPVDTEVVMGSNKLEFFGQADNIWIGYIKGKLGFLITDWKTNKSKNMKNIPNFHKLLEPPLDIIRDNTLGKYMAQQVLYAILFLDMLKDTKYNDIEFFGFRILKLRDEPEIIKIPKKLMNRFMGLLENRVKK